MDSDHCSCMSPEALVHLGMCSLLQIHPAVLQSGSQSIVPPHSWMAPSRLMYLYLNQILAFDSSIVIGCTPSRGINSLFFPLVEKTLCGVIMQRAQEQLQDTCAR